MAALKGIPILCVVVGLILGFVALCTALKVQNFWVGFLFMFYWMGLEQARMDKYLSSAIGSLLGLLVSFGASVFSAHLGADMGALAAFAVSMVLIYVRIIGRLKFFVNQATVLFLTVGSIPVLHSTVSASEMFISLFLGLVFFGSLGGIGALLERYKNNRLAKSSDTPVGEE
jgi:hypothetical protein